MGTLNDSLTAVHDVLAAWGNQLITNDTLRSAIEAGGQVEVRLFANAGKVRKSPVIVLNAGPSAMVGI